MTNECKRLHLIIVECASYLGKYPGLFKDKDETHKKRTLELYEQWITEYSKYNRKIKALSLSDVRWLAYAHLMACETRLNRTVSKDDIKTTHGFVRMVLKEWNFRARKWKPVIPSLELRAISNIVFCPEVECSANFSKDNVYPVNFNIDNKPDMYDWEEEGDWDDVDNTYTDKFDSSSSSSSSDQTKKNKSSSSSDEKEKESIDYTEERYSGNLAHFKLHKIEPSVFASDCSRLFFWCAVYDDFIEHHKIEQIKEKHTMTQCENNLIKILTKQCDYENTQTNVVFDMLYKFHLPIGAQLAYQRVYQTRDHTITRPKDILDFDAGVPITRCASDKMIPVPKKAMLECKRTDKIFECWSIALFHQMLFMCQCDFIKEFIFFSEQIYTHREFMDTETQWISRLRRPIILKLCGVWYVQLPGILWECVDVINALAVWCLLMYSDKFDCTTSSRVNLRSVLKNICSRT